VKVGYVRKLAYEQAIGGATELITLSVNPPVFLAKNFLSKPEADEFIAEAKRKGGWKDSGYSEDEEGAPHSHLLQKLEVVTMTPNPF